MSRCEICRYRDRRMTLVGLGGALVCPVMRSVDRDCFELEGCIVVEEEKEET